MATCPRRRAPRGVRARRRTRRALRRAILDAWATALSLDLSAVQAHGTPARVARVPVPVREEGEEIRVGHWDTLSTRRRSSDTNVKACADGAGPRRLGAFVRKAGA